MPSTCRACIALLPDFITKLITRTFISLGAKASGVVVRLGRQTSTQQLRQPLAESRRGAAFGMYEKWDLDDRSKIHQELHHPDSTSLSVRVPLSMFWHARAARHCERGRSWSIDRFQCPAGTEPARPNGATLTRCCSTGPLSLSHRYASTCTPCHRSIRLQMRGDLGCRSSQFQPRRSG
jgi:hypothetical protein